jgi:hypothetical protein
MKLLLITVDVFRIGIIRPTSIKMLYQRPALCCLIELLAANFSTKCEIEVVQENNIQFRK